MRSLLHGILGGIVAALLPVAIAAADDDAGHERFRSDYQRDYVFGAPSAPSDDWILASGGRLYDDWAETLAGQLPSSTHPAYPSAGKQKGAATWRCKECHGWDYRGRDGAYATGSHATGISGLRHVAGADPAKVIEVLRGPQHGYTAAMIPDEALHRLARFVVAGQFDTAAAIDNGTKTPVGGMAARGKTIFQNVCAACHGFDGRSIDFAGGEGEPEFIGTVAADNPWEAIHKIANGQPGTPMPAMRVFGLETALDLLAYMQTLPTEGD